MCKLLRQALNLAQIPNWFIWLHIKVKHFVCKTICDWIGRHMNYKRLELPAIDSKMRAGFCASCMDKRFSSKW